MAEDTDGKFDAFKDGIFRGTTIAKLELHAKQIEEIWKSFAGIDLKLDAQSHKLDALGFALAALETELKRLIEEAKTAATPVLNNSKTMLSGAIAGGGGGLGALGMLTYLIGKGQGWW